MTMAGHCLCGAVRVRVERYDPALSACHCAPCRRWSGGPVFGLQAPPDAVQVEGPVKCFASSAFAERAWCDRCGTHLWFRDTDDPAAAYEFVPGIFGYREDFVLDHENYAERAGPMALAGDHRGRLRARQPERRQQRSAGMIEGCCLCGAVGIRVEGHDAGPGACHCRMCQIWTGGVLLAFTAPATAVAVTGEVTRYRSSEIAERAFCPHCGSHLWMRSLERENADYDLMPGLFDEAAGWPLRSEIYADRAMACVRLEGDHTRRTQSEWEAENSSVEGYAE